MKNFLKLLVVVFALVGMFVPEAFAQTGGGGAGTCAEPSTVWASVDDGGESPIVCLMRVDWQYPSSPQYEWVGCAFAPFSFAVSSPGDYTILAVSDARHYQTLFGNSWDWNKPTTFYVGCGQTASFSVTRPTRPAHFVGATLVDFQQSSTTTTLSYQVKVEAFSSGKFIARGTLNGQANAPASLGAGEVSIPLARKILEFRRPGKRSYTVKFTVPTAESQKWYSLALDLSPAGDRWTPADRLWAGFYLPYSPYGSAMGDMSADAAVASGPPKEILPSFEPEIPAQFRK